MTADDSTLARRAAQGDGDAFGELVCRYQSVIFNVALRLLGDAHTAEDAAQETFIRAYRFIARFEPERPIGPWLKKIAVNVCLNLLARHADLPLAANHDAPAPDPGPESQAVEQEFNRQVRAAILSLPPRYRAAIELRHFQNLSYAEMAEALRHPLSDVKSDLFRARKLLAQQLKDLQP